MGCHTTKYFGYKGCYFGCLVNFEDVEAVFEGSEFVSRLGFPLEEAWLMAIRAVFLGGRACE